VIRVALVDDQTLVRQGIRSLLALDSEIEVVAEAEDGVQALEVLDPETVDVVLLDVRMPGKSGIEVLRQLRREERQPPTILLTTFDDDTAALEGIQAGARGFLLKDVTLEELTGAIRAVARGETHLKPGLTERILQGLRSLPKEFDALDPPDPLTAREVEIVRLMAAGYSNREIAEALHLVEGTVKNHISSILSKLGVRDRTRAVLKAVELEYF
jgi:DNA-binding NarL/FixJ family response regulator